MKLWATLIAVTLLVGCQTQLTPGEEQKLQRMNKAMTEDGGGVQGTGAGQPGGGNNPAKPAIIDGAIEL